MGLCPWCFEDVEECRNTSDYDAQFAAHVQKCLKVPERVKAAYMRPDYPPVGKATALHPKL